MGVVIPFNTESCGQTLGDSEEVHILSEKHKVVLRERLHYLTKLVTNKDMGFIQRETLKKVEEMHSSKEFVAKLILRVRLLHQMLFDDKFPKSRTTRKIVAAGLLYFISSGDFMSDNIPGLGYLDDAYIIREIWGKVSKEIKDYIIFKGMDEKQYI